SNEGVFPARQTRLTLVKESSDAATLAALQAAGNSYAPYTKSYSGVAIANAAGLISRGAYIENVAFNPSLPPFQTALAQWILSGKEYTAISRVVLAELQEAAISQKSVTEAALATIAPGVHLEIVLLKPT